jgi:hypothetical protein
VTGLSRTTARPTQDGALADAQHDSPRQTRERRSCPHDVHMTAYKIDYDDLEDHVLAVQQALDLEPTVGVEPTTYRLQGRCQMIARCSPTTD